MFTYVVSTVCVCVCVCARVRVRVHVCVSVSMPVSRTLFTFTELTFRIHCAEILNLRTFLFMCVAIKGCFVAKCCNCVSDFFLDFFFNSTFDIKLSKKIYLLRDTVLLNIECQVSLAPLCMLFIGIYCTIHVSVLRPRKHRITFCPHLSGYQSPLERFEPCTFQVHSTNVDH